MTPYALYSALLLLHHSMKVVYYKVVHYMGTRVPFGMHNKTPSRNNPKPLPPRHFR